MTGIALLTALQSDRLPRASIAEHTADSSASTLAVTSELSP